MKYFPNPEGWTYFGENWRFMVLVSELKVSVRLQGYMKNKLLTLFLYCGLLELRCVLVLLLSFILGGGSCGPLDRQLVWCILLLLITKKNLLISWQCNYAVCWPFDVWHLRFLSLLLCPPSHSLFFNKKKKWLL